MKLFPAEIKLGAKLDQVKSMFFDKAVVSWQKRVTVKALSRFGAYVRKSARDLIRKRKKASEPGKPPSSHTGILKKFIFFAYEGFRENVIIGPTKTNQKFVQNGGLVSGTVPEVLEHGGEIGIFEVFKYGQWQRADLRSRRRIAGLPTRVRKVTIQARPYMQPAFQENRPKLPEIWAQSVIQTQAA